MRKMTPIGQTNSWIQGQYNNIPSFKRAVLVSNHSLLVLGLFPLTWIIALMPVCPTNSSLLLVTTSYLRFFLKRVMQRA